MATDIERGRPSWRMVALLVLITAIVWGLDQAAKYFVVENLVESGPPVPLIGELVQLRFVRNSGAAFSLASGFTWILSILAAAVIALIVWFAPRIRSARWAAVFGLILGGALGNLTDRLFREPGFGTGHVIDFIQLIYFPAIFNVADIAITSSVVLFVLLTLLGVGLDGARRQAADVRSASAKGAAMNPSEDA